MHSCWQWKVLTYVNTPKKFMARDINVSPNHVSGGSFVSLRAAEDTSALVLKAATSPLWRNGREVVATCRILAGLSEIGHEKADVEPKSRVKRSACEGTGRQAAT